jgi:translation initiation factor IF-3
MGKNFQKKETLSFRVNDEIRCYDARVIYKEHNDAVSENDFNKIMKVSDARHIAETLGLDLIEINANTNPPILKIYDYKKYLWEMKQIEKKKKKNVIDVKEIQLSVNISPHDMETKAKHAKEFIAKGHKVRVVLTMRGRELTRRDESSKSFYEFLEMMGDDISYDSAPKNEGNKLITILKKKK